MSMQGTTWPMARAAVAVAIGITLAACGGDGGDGPGPIDLTAANRDAVAHASAAAAMAMSPAGAIALTPTGMSAGFKRTAAAGSTSMSLATSRLMAMVLQPARARLVAHDGARRALAVSGPVIEPCSAGGSISVTLDDRDNSLDLSVGDVLTLSFANCRESPSEVMNGTAVATYTQLAQFPAVTIGARLALTQLSMSEAQHSMRLDGVVLMDFRQTGSSTHTIRVTADGNVVAGVVTHVFSDTVTMRHGFLYESQFDSAAAPPPGGSQPGRTTSTLQGEVESTAAGGVLTLSATASAPIVDYDADPNPRSGVVRVTSRKGTVLLTALSPEQVRVDLDADDNGAFESSTTVSWDWLL